MLVQLPRVLLQVEVPTEPLAADPTRERLLLIVRVHVKRQVVDLVERLWHANFFISHRWGTYGKHCSRNWV